MLKPYLPPEQTAVTENPSAARNVLERDFAVSRISASLSEIRLLDDATIDLHGTVIPCTQSFLESLAASIGMPFSYAYSIDYELFKHNFDQRKKIKDKAIQVCVVADRAVGLADGEYRPARTIDVMAALDNVNDNFWKFHKISLSDRSVEVDLLSERFILEPKPGDTIRSGIRISNSETGGTGLKASVYTLRLACSNGATLREELGCVRWSYDARVTYVSSVAKFARGVMNLHSGQELLTSLYASAVQAPILEEDIVRLWRRIRVAGHFTPERADEVLGITREERQHLHAAVAERRSTGLREMPSDKALYSVHNAITAAARTLPLQTRSRLERIGGDVLSFASVN